MGDADSEIVIRFNEKRGFLEVACDSAISARILEFIRTEALPNHQQFQLPLGGVTEIYIVDIGGKKVAPSAKWKDWAVLWGCGLIAFAVLFFALMGIIAISGLIPLPR